MCFRIHKLTCVSQIFKIVLSKAFDLRCTIPEIENVGEPLVLYQAV
jgi:GTP-binding protein of the ras superfamily involved in termination of M-phase